jgi:hypothetical protein
MADGVRINLICCTQVLSDLAADKRVTRKNIAVTYAMAIKSAAEKADDPDWKAINGAILARWKMSGLEWIKKRAFDILSGKINPAGAVGGSSQ